MIQVYNFDGKIHNDGLWADTINSKEMAVAKGLTVFEDGALILSKNGNYFSLPTDYGSYGTFELLVKIDESFTPISTSYWYECSCIFGCELSGGQRDWGLVIDRNGYFAIGHGWGDISSTDVIASDGQWRTLAMVVGTSDMKLYIDGVLKQSVNITMSGTAISTYGVGWNKSGTNTSVTGYIGTLKVWSDSLTDEEVAYSYNESLTWLNTEPDDSVKTFSHYIDFNDAKWMKKRPEVFTLTDGETPFKVDSTFLYEEKPTYRSGAIGGSSTSSSIITCNLIQNGYIEFNYTVSSENYYDWLRVLIDDVEVVKVAGNVSWTTTRQMIPVGEHKIEFRYSKDGSGNSGSDAGAIGYLKFVGVEKAFVKKYLICSENKLYTISNEAIVELSDNTIHSSLFVNYGFDDLDNISIVVGLNNPEILYWQESENDPIALKATMTATPLPQTIITDAIDITHQTITGIASVTGECEGSPMFSCEFNGVWKEHNGTDWVDESSGMTWEAIQAITSEQWDEMITGLNDFRIKFILDSADDKVAKLNVNFNVDVSQYLPLYVSEGTNQFLYG